MAKNKIFVTGSDGFIGSHLVEELVSQGFRVKALCQYNSFNSWGWLDSFSENQLNEIEIVSGDIRDFNGLKSLMQGCDSVMHLAALIAIPYSYSSPESYIDTNVKGTLNVVQAARDLNMKRVLVTSTSEVYGTAQYVPIDESHRKHAQSPYAATKIAADEIALSYYRSFGTRVRIIRPFNTYGPRQSFRAVIPTIIGQVLNPECEEIFLGNLQATRDFNFVTDTASGFVCMSKNENCDGKALNVASNFEISILDIAKLVMDYLDIHKKISTDASRLRPKNSEVERLFGSNREFIKLTGWKPEFSGIDGFRKGIKKTIEWFKLNNKISKEYSL